MRYIQRARRRCPRERARRITSGVLVPLALSLLWNLITKYYPAGISTLHTGSAVRGSGRRDRLGLVRVETSVNVSVERPGPDSLHPLRQPPSATTTPPESAPLHPSPEPPEPRVFCRVIVACHQGTSPPGPPSGLVYRSFGTRGCPFRPIFPTLRPLPVPGSPPEPSPTHPV